MRFSTRRANVARLYPVKSNARVSFRWLRTSSSPSSLPTPSATFLPAGPLLEHLGLDETPQHLDAPHHQLHVAPEPVRAHRLAPRLRPPGHRLRQRHPILQRT